MRRSNVTLAVLVALAAIGALFYVTDPLGLFGSGREDGAGGAGGELGAAGGPSLESAGKRAKVFPKEVGGEPVGVLTLTLGDSTLKGSVVGEKQPLPLARVVPLLPPPFPGTGVHTDQKGNWEIRGLPAGEHLLRVSAHGWRTKTEGAPAVQLKETKDVPPIELTRPLARNDGLEVKVTDMEGRPIAGAQVLATTLSWSVDVGMGHEMAGVRDVIRRNATTDEKGVALMESLPPEDYDVVATAVGRTAAAVEGVSVGRGRVLPVTIRLGPGFTISGKVVDGSGKAVANAFVMGFHQPGWFSSFAKQTAADGTFVLDGLREGNYVMIAGEEAHGSTFVNRVASPSAGLVLTLGGAGTIEGTLKTPEGAPVKVYDVRVAMSGPFGYEYSRVIKVSDADGRFKTQAPPGSYEVRLITPEGAMARADKQAVEVDKTTTFALVLPPAGVVRGVVTDPAGNHLEGAEVYVNRGGMPGGPDREQYSRTDPDGHFEVRSLDLETVSLHVRHAGWADTTWQGKSTPAVGSPEIVIKMNGGAKVAGQVKRADGKGAVGEQVNLYQSWFDPRTTFCDGEGRYAFEHVAAGEWSLTTGLFEQGASGLSKTGFVVPTEGTVTIDLAYTEGQGTVTGVVVLAGKPVVGATVYAGDERGTDTSASVTTDEQGGFRATGLSLGRIQVYVETPDGLTTTKSVRLTQEKPNGEIRIEFGTAALRGRCQDAGGQPVTSAWVTVEKADTPGSSVGSRAVESTGLFELKGLPAGTYRLRIWANGYAQATTDVFTLAAEESRDMGAVPLQRGADLAGRVTNDVGHPVENATISLKDHTGRPVYTFSLFTTGSDGRYTVQGVVPGRYTVGAEARGLAPTTKQVDVDAAGATADLVLTRGGSVKVRVIDAAGHPVEGARVVLTDASGEAVTRTLSLVTFFESGRDRTGPEGETTIPDLASGTYRVKAVTSGSVLAGEEPSITITPGAAASISLTLVDAPK
jgi:protocatechuate 3,4-dioxygenase beta subunit